VSILLDEDETDLSKEKENEIFNDWLKSVVSGFIRHAQSDFEEQGKTLYQNSCFPIYKELSKEFVCRELALKMVRDMPFKDLEKLFQFSEHRRPEVFRGGELIEGVLWNAKIFV
jgi:hypothetical protein